MPVRLYLDFLSQPSRALYIFSKLTNLPLELCFVNLREGEHLSEEFKNEKNRFQKVPFVHDGDFKLAESIAILRYLAEKFNVDNHWYPKDAQQRARVDEYLEWQHNNTRALCALYFIKKWLIPSLTGTEPPPESLEKFKRNMIDCLDTIENLWLADTPFIAGNQISVADIVAACELEQPRIAGFDPAEGHPKLAAWWRRVRKETDPFYTEAHQIVNKLVENDEKKKALKAKL